MLESSINQTRRLALEIGEINARLREIVARAREVLDAPMPDTFLGRERFK